jgi:hypothetical protein
MQPAQLLCDKDIQEKPLFGPNTAIPGVQQTEEKLPRVTEKEWQLTCLYSQKSVHGMLVLRL